MSAPVIRMAGIGLGASIQDLGRFGWKRYGVPPSGAMDPHAAAWANRLAGNPDGAPVIELLMQGAQLGVLATVRIAVAGADASCAIPAWSSTVVRAGTRLDFPRNRCGLWTYVAVEGGFEARRILGSASSYSRGGLGTSLEPGAILLRGTAGRASAAVANSWAAPGERRDYLHPPAIAVWRGPQWDWFDEPAREAFLGAEWETSMRSDRAGYRLDGARIRPPETEMVSEPVVVGSVQVPPSGQPIVTMRDGPTVGGYPKIAVVEPESLGWLAQCGPGVRYRFSLVG